MAKEWEATKQMGDAIECGDEEEISFEMTEQNASCRLKCELPLRWGLPCRHWMYAAFVDNSPIPLSLIHPRWFLDGPDYLEKPSRPSHIQVYMEIRHSQDLLQQ